MGTVSDSVQMDSSVYCWSPSRCQVIQEDVIIANVSVTFLLRGQHADKFPKPFIHQKSSISAADAAASPLHDNDTFIFPSNYPATCEPGQHALFFSYDTLKQSYYISWRCMEIF